MTEEIEVPEKGKKKRLRKVIAAVVGVVAVVVIVLVLLVQGIVGLPGAAAKYGTLSYIWEQEVTDYIADYRASMGYADCTDEEWATFLKSNSLTPEKLRLSTINQLLCDRVVEEECARLGITVSDEEVNKTLETIKYYYAYGDDQTWEELLSASGRSQQDVFDMYKLQLLKMKLYNDQVEMPEVNDTDVKNYMSSISSSLESYNLKHSYCLRIKVTDEVSALDATATAESARAELMADGVNLENFQSIVVLYGTDDTLAETYGGNGWDIDSSSYSTGYQNALAATEVGEVSEVFTDGDDVSFIWVDATYDFPSGDTAIANADLSEMPDTLKSYLEDSAAYWKWEEYRCPSYLNTLVTRAKLTSFAMPSNVPYNVDMSLASS